MTAEELRNLKQWFDAYTKSFYTGNGEDQRNILLKVEHTRNVCRNIVEIAGASDLGENETRVAEAVALFHDVGRFDQYARYKTFRDADSENHGLLGSKVLHKEKVLSHLPEDEQEMVIGAVKFHNAIAIPTGLSEDAVLFLKLIRDADKVDIFRVFIEYYESPAEKRASATAFGVPDNPEYSEVMLSSIFRRQVASYSKIRTENDFKLLKISWVYDIHFDGSLRLLLQRRYLDRVMDKLPQTDEIKSALSCVQKYISKRLCHV